MPEKCGYIMKFERVDDKTVKCFLSNEELKEYEIDYKDFLTRSEKAKEMVHEIIRQATEEVGYQPPKFAFDLQIMMIPEQGLVLTFSEKDPLDGKEGSRLMDYLREMKKALDMAASETKQGDELSEESDDNDLPTDVSSSKKKSGKKVQKEQKPIQAVFEFEKLDGILELAKVIPGKLRVKSVLYEMDGKYYLYLHKGKASYEKYSKVCIQAMEFGVVYGAAEDSILFIEEHGDCIIEKHALRKLKF